MARQEEGPTALTHDGTKDGDSGSSAPEAFAARLQRSYLNFRWPLFLLDPEESTRPCLENGWSRLARWWHMLPFGTVSSCGVCKLP